MQIYKKISDYIPAAYKELSVIPFNGRYGSGRLYEKSRLPSACQTEGGSPYSGGMFRGHAPLRSGQE